MLHVATFIAVSGKHETGAETVDNHSSLKLNNKGTYQPYVRSHLRKVLEVFHLELLAC